MHKIINANIFLWALYDFANSFIFVAFFLYYSQWVVIDSGLPDLWFNLVFVSVSILLLITAPKIGKKLDEGWSNLRGIQITSAFIVLGYAITAILAFHQLAVWSLVTFTFGLYFFILSFIFYTPLLSRLSTNAHHGFVSGFGLTANSIGVVLGMVLALPFGTGQISLFSRDARIETIVPALLVFIIFALPMLLFFREDRLLNDPNVSHSRASVWHRTRALFSSRSILLFIIAFVLFSGAIQTASNNFPIFLEQVWQIADTIKSFILVALIVCSAGGSLFSGWLLDRWGWYRVAISILISWIVVLLILSVAPTFPLFLGVALFAGVLVGASATMARTAMAHLLPSHSQNFGFSYFTIVERASTIVTPIAWGVIVSGLSDLESLRYRIAMIAMALFVALGLIVLLRIRPHKSELCQNK